jgi:hypothetical protein
MSHIHVCLVSEQPIPNLTTMLQFRPEHVILLKTKEMEEKACLLKDVIKQKGFEVTDEVIEAYDINNVINVSESIIKRCKECNVTLNITGGTKIGTLGTFQAFYTAGKVIFYVDTLHNKILQLFPESQQQDIEITVKISIKDYLAAYGFIVEDFVKDDSYIFKRKDLTNALANNIDTVKQLNQRLHPFDEEYTQFPVTISISVNDKFKSIINQLNGVSLEGNMLKINDFLSLRYLKGGWFEEYVYMQAKALVPDEIKLNVTGRWVTSSKHKPKNEFDVLFSKGNRLFYISCKTSNPNRKTYDKQGTDDAEGVGREYLYELDSIGDTALGLFGKRMIASARKIEDPYIKGRARILKIDVVDGKDIITMKDKLRQWLLK